MAVRGFVLQLKRDFTKNRRIVIFSVILPSEKNISEGDEESDTTRRHHVIM